MTEIFFDEVGVLFSDGQNVKFSLRSVHPGSRGESLEDVALLVCKTSSIPELAKLLNDFLTKQANIQGNHYREREAEDGVKKTVKESGVEEHSLSLGKTKVPHS
jgi:hypothetical protein